MIKGVATEVMRADAGLHADPTRRQIGEPGPHLATRPLLPQHDGTALILAHKVERVLPMSIPITQVIALLSLLGMACSLSLAPLASFACWCGRSTAGPSH